MAPVPGDVRLRARYETEGATVRRYDSASFWDARYHQRRFSAIVERLVPLLRDAQSFLDVGCGTGEYLDVAACTGVARVYGVDLSSEYCRRARILCPTAEVNEASAAELPFEDRGVDVVLCSEVLEHLPAETCARAVAELERVTRSHLIVTTPNRAALIRNLAARLRPQLVEQLDDEVGHINLLDPGQLAAHLASTAWRTRAIDVFHIVPPVVGERIHLPRVAAGLVTGIEAAANRVVPRAGNAMLAVVERRDPSGGPHDRGRP